jgi:hypothetical protein
MSSRIEGEVETVPQKKLTCIECQNAYSIEDYLASSPNYFDAPCNYQNGCAKYCLNCWLGLPNAKSADEASLRI